MPVDLSAGDFLQQSICKKKKKKVHPKHHPAIITRSRARAVCFVRGLLVRLRCKGGEIEIVEMDGGHACMYICMQSQI